MTLRIEDTIQLDSGLLIPASAGAGKYLQSDASGNATWAAFPGSFAPSAHHTSHEPGGSDVLTALTDASIAAANKDGVAATASLRTLGVGAQQSMPGDNGGAWTAFTPTWAGAVTNPTIGNGSITAAHKRIGTKLCVFRIVFAFGSTTNGGTGAYTIGNLPFTTIGVEQTVLTKLFVPSVSGNFFGFGYLPPSNTQVLPQMPASTTNGLYNTMQSAASGGAAGTGIPLIAASFPVQSGGNLVIGGTYEIA